MISGYTCKNYISVSVNEKRFLLISVSVFELKVYTLDHIGKNGCLHIGFVTPPRGFMNWMELNAHQVCRHRGQDKYTCHYEGYTKELKSLSGFQNHTFYHEEDKKM